jgi:hypothetical protein
LKLPLLADNYLRALIAALRAPRVLRAVGVFVVASDDYTPSFCAVPCSTPCAVEVKDWSRDLSLAQSCMHPLRANFSRSGQVYAYSDEHSQGSRFNVNGLLIGIIESKTRQRSARTIKIAMQRVTSSKPVRHLTAVDFLNHRLV